MNIGLIQKYITGNATEEEKHKVVEWIDESPEHLREYIAYRKLYEISLWNEPNGGKVFKNTERYKFKKILSSIAKVAAVLALIISGGMLWSNLKDSETIPEYQTIYVPAGQRAELHLSDGTTVWLNSRSKLIFPGTFKRGLRRVRLEGEGYFDVKHDEDHPFIVSTDKYDVKVLGTEFNVIAYVGDSVWETSLLKGKVEIMKSGQDSYSGMCLEPNTMAHIVDGVLMKGTIREADYFRWREGLICFDHLTVREIMYKLSLYYGIDIKLNNKLILNERYTGKFRVKDGIEQVLRVLQLNHRFTYVRDDENNCIIIN